jgi:transglutaminase-like putative cysteine protease
VTSYDYALPVPFGQHVLRLTPADRAGQSVVAASLEIEPRPTERREWIDFFGNRVTGIGVELKHDRLVVVARARVRVTSPLPILAELTPAWDSLVDMAARIPDLSKRSPVHGLFPSRLVPLDPDVRAYAQKSFPPGRPALAGALDLMARIKADFRYEPGTTDVATPLRIAFAERTGVCQDFAHIMISGLRGLGIPALYVSGYIRTVPPPGRPPLEGADAMHAWVAVWCGEEAGWRGLDPTNDLLVGEDHIVLALGRDYADIAPVDGVIVSSGGQDLDCAVSVVPLDEGRPAVQS